MKIQYFAPAPAARFRRAGLPATADRRRCAKHKPAGIFLSNGPGDPAALNYIVREVKNARGQRHSDFWDFVSATRCSGRRSAGKPSKLKFGHRGANQPVKDLESGRVEITSQNHGFAVDAKSLAAGVAVNRINFEHQTVEGMRHKTSRFFCDAGGQRFRVHRETLILRRDFDPSGFQSPSPAGSRRDGRNFNLKVFPPNACPSIWWRDKSQKSECRLSNERFYLAGQCN